MTGVAKKKRVILVGLDGLMPEQIDRYASESEDLRWLLERSFFAPAYSSPYTDTPTNWTTIATGAQVGTHGCTSFYAHLPGMGLGEGQMTFNSDLCQSEYFWSALHRQGRRSILINYPCAYPDFPDGTVVVGGDGLYSFDWTVREMEILHTSPGDVSRDIFCSVVEIESTSDQVTGIEPSLEFVRAGIVHLPPQGIVRWDAAGILLGDRPVEAGSAEVRHIAVVRDEGTLLVLLAKSADFSAPVAVLSPGEWSGWVREEYGGRQCLRQFQLVEISEDGGRVVVFASRAGTRSNWGSSDAVEELVRSTAGAYVEGVEIDAEGLLGFDDNDALSLSLMKLQGDCLATSAAALAEANDWDAMWMHYHVPDGINHAYIGHLEGPDPVRRERADATLRETVRIAAAFARKIVEDCADEDTLVAVLSDHGCVPKDRCAAINVLLHERGWLIIDGFRNGVPQIDQARSKALVGQHGIWLNVEGRERDGCVKAGREYEELRTEILDALAGLRDPVTGESPFALFGRREDFESMGIHGERCEDIIFFPRTTTLTYWFDTNESMYASGEVFYDINDVIARGALRRLSAVHWGLPECRTALTSNRAAIFLIGPGVTKETRGSARVNLIDVAPTLAMYLGVDPPRNSEGRLLREAFDSASRDQMRHALSVGIGGEA